MTTEAPETEAPESPLPLIELDRTLAPLRRTAAWATGARGLGLAFLEHTAHRWVDQALRLDLPAPVVQLLAEVRQSVDGYDSADEDGRAERVTSLYQAVLRVDSLLGLPLTDVRIRRPRKPRLPNWRVEEAPATVEPAAPDGEAIPEDVLLTSASAPAPAKRSKRRKKSPRKPEVAAPPPPFWDGRLGASVADLDLPRAVVDALEEAGIQSVGDLLFTAPSESEVLRPVHGAGRPIPEGAQRVAVGGRVRARVSRCFPDGRVEHRVTLKGAADAVLVWPAGAEALRASGGLDAYALGERVIVAANVSDVPLEFCDAERAFDDGAGGVRLRSYDIDGASDVVVRGLIGRLLPLLEHVRDLFPSAELQRNGIEGLKELIPEIHHRDLERGRKRLAFDEAFLVQVGLALKRYRSTRDRGLQLTPLHGLLAKVMDSHGLVLDDTQQVGFEDIKRDLRRRTPMRRVLTGAMGSGRGAVALATVLSVAEGKVQAMVLCADAKAAEQAYMFAAYPLREGGLVARLIEDEPTTAIRDAVERGEIHVVYGTLELLRAGLDFRRLGLIVAEELESPGVAAAAVLAMRSPRPHLLTIPVAPITGAQALSVYADHDMTVLAGGAPEPAVQLFPGAERSVAYGRAAEAVAAGSQILVLFPLMKGEDALEIREAWRLVKALEADAFGTAKIGLFHSKMSRDERLRAYEDFEHRRLHVLVATTPIEGAPAAARAAGLVLEQAERFDPVRQRRLRGFLNPESGAPQIWCVCGGEVEEAEARLAPLRGEGEWPPSATPVSPEDLPSFQWLDLDRDGEIVWRAREAAHRLAASDPRLRSGWATEVARTLRSRWTDLLGDDPPELVVESGSEGSSGSPRSGGRRRRRRRRKR